VILRLPKKTHWPICVVVGSGGGGWVTVAGVVGDTLPVGGVLGSGWGQTHSDSCIEQKTAQSVRKIIF
jgi:hypothetical protein